jgi:hypothetical protein
MRSKFVAEMKKMDPATLPKLNKAIANLNLSEENVNQDETSQCKLEKVVQNYTPIAEDQVITAQHGLQFAQFLQAITIVPPKIVRKVSIVEER